MPAYGKNLSPAETTALVAFLETLHPTNQKPARNASEGITLRRKRGLSTVNMAMSEFNAQILRWVFLFVITSTLVVMAWIYLHGWYALRKCAFSKPDRQATGSRRL